MVGVFFLCKNSSMDVLKLCDILFENKDLHDIPIDYIFRVAYAVIVAISSGECFFEDDFD